MSCPKLIHNDPFLLRNGKAVFYVLNVAMLWQCKQLFHGGITQAKIDHDSINRRYYDSLNTAMRSGSQSLTVSIHRVPK